MCRWCVCVKLLLHRQSMFASNKNFVKWWKRNLLEERRLSIVHFGINLTLEIEWVGTAVAQWWYDIALWVENWFLLRWHSLFVRTYGITSVYHKVHIYSSDICPSKSGVLLIISLFCSMQRKVIFCSVHFWATADWSFHVDLGCFDYFHGEQK